MNWITITTGFTQSDWLRSGIICEDFFGGFINNIRLDHLKKYLAQLENIHIILKDIKINGIFPTFGEGAMGNLAAVVKNFGYLPVCAADGRAAVEMRGRAGDKLQMYCS